MHWCIHGGAGVLIANLLPEQPFLALTASWIAHYPFDWLPHKDPGIATTTVKWSSKETQEFLRVSLPDIAITMIGGWYVPASFTSMPFWTTVGCVLASVMPDIIDGIAKLSNSTVLQWHRRFHDRIHYDHYTWPVPQWLNCIIQFGVGILIIVITRYVVINGTDHVTAP